MLLIVAVGMLFVLEDVGLLLIITNGVISIALLIIAFIKIQYIKILRDKVLEHEISIL